MWSADFLIDIVVEPLNRWLGFEAGSVTFLSTSVYQSWHDDDRADHSVAPAKSTPYERWLGKYGYTMVPNKSIRVRSL